MARATQRPMPKAQSPSFGGQAWITLLCVTVLLASHASAADNLIAFNTSGWKYLVTTTDPPATWPTFGFDDSAWPTGTGQLGYGDGDEATVLASGKNAYYFRRAFNAPDPASYPIMTLKLVRDDGAVVYLNGSEIFRSNMPDGTVVYATKASTSLSAPTENEYVTYNFVPSNLAAGPNVLAVEVHQGASTSDISFDAALLGGLAVLRGPYLQSGSPTGLKVHWRTNAATDSRVQYGDAPGNLTSEVSDAALTTEHILTLTGLTANTRYYYSIGTTTQVLAGDDAEHFFNTAPATGTAKATRVWVLGDSGEANLSERQVRDAFYTFNGGAKNPDLWMMLGDDAYDVGTDDQFQAAVFDTFPLTLQQSVLWSVLGNHETDQSEIPSPPASYPYFDNFDFPADGSCGGVASGTEAYYSFDYGTIHFIVLDSMTSGRASNGAMAAWLKSDLASVGAGTNWIIACWHHPPYTKGSHDSDTEPELIEMRKNLLPILEAGGVDLVLCGHSHSYERSYLLNGHYGSSGTLASAMKLDSGDGRPDGNGAYDKAHATAFPNEGIVYAVLGSSSRVGGGSLDHPAHCISLNAIGSLVLDINGTRLDAHFLDNTGLVRDHFTLLKGVNDSSPPSVPAGLAVTGQTASTISLIWDAAADNVGIGGYKILRNGVIVAQVTNLRYTDTALDPNTTYAYSVKAQDVSGNQSAASDTVNGTTDAAPGICTWTGGAGDNDWGTDGNWSSGVPSPGGSVVFPAVANMTVNNAPSISLAFVIFNAGGYTLSPNTSTLTVTDALIDYASSDTNTVQCILGGAGNVKKYNAGTLVLAGVNTYTGTTSVDNNGVLSVSADSGLGAAPPVDSPVANSIVLTNGGTLLVTVASNWTLAKERGITLGSGGGKVNVSANTLTYMGIITGSGSLSKIGAGIFNLGGASNYKGGTTIANGTIRLTTNNNQLPNYGALTITSPGILDMASKPQRIWSLAGDGTVTTGTNAVAAQLTIAGSDSTVFSGILQNGAGALALVKDGSGTLALTGNNTYSGATTVNAGTLRLTGQTAPNSGTGSSSVVVNAGGTLSGNGRIGGSVTVANDATAILYPNSSAALTMGGDLTINANSTVEFGLSSSAAGANDKVALQNRKLTPNGSQVRINCGNTLDMANNYVLFDVGSTGAISGSFNATPLWTGTTPQNAGRYSIATLGNQVLLGVPATQIALRETLDTNGNGHIDAIRIVTNLPLNDDFASLNITVAGYTVAGYDTGATANDNEFFVRLAEGTTPDTDTAPGVRVVAIGSLAELGGGMPLPVDAAPVAPTDNAKPVLMSASWYDGSGAGVDAGDPIYLTFSEPVTSNNALAVDFGLPVANDTYGAGAAVSNGQNTTDPKIVTITLQGDPLLTPGGVYSPGLLTAGSPTGVYVADGTRIVDAAGNSALVQTIGTAVDLQPGTEHVSICWDDLSIAPRDWDLGLSDQGAAFQAFSYFPPNGLVVRNNGNVREKFAMSCSTAYPSGWAVATAAGQNQFEVKTANSGPPYVSYPLDLATGPQNIATQLYSGHNQAFDLQFRSPTAGSSGAGVGQTITVTITAAKD